MEENLYQTPESELKVPLIDDRLELASRWSRLGASIIDSIIIMLVLMPIFYFTGYFSSLSAGQQPPLLQMLMYAVLGIVIFVVINGKFLVQSGQTVGKKILGIKITDLNQQSPTTSALFKRYGLYLGLGQIPFIGEFFSIINVLFIFSKSKRCLHDLAAKTIVIKNP